MSVAVFSSGKDGDFTRYPYADMPSDFNALERDWYKEAMANKGKTIVTEPYESISSGKMVVTIARQTVDGSGVVAIDMKIDDLVTTAKGINIGKEGYAFILSQNKKVIAYSGEKAGTELKGDWVDKLYKDKSGDFEYTYKGKKKKWHLQQAKQQAGKSAARCMQTRFTMRKQGSDHGFNRSGDCHRSWNDGDLFCDSIHHKAIETHCRIR